MFVRGRNIAILLQALNRVPVFLKDGVRKTEIKITVGKFRRQFDGSGVVHFCQCMVSNFGVKVSQVIMGFVMAGIFLQAKGK